MSRGQVLITGATGMVGLALTPRLIQEGYRVRVMLRATSDRRLIEGWDVGVVQADLAEPESLDLAVRDVEYVVHAAAHVGDWGPAEKYRQRNVVALEHLLTAARRHGRLRRWIQVSSLGVYPARCHHGTDETVPPDLGGLDGYTRTKAEAEVLLQRHMHQFSLPATILRPGFIYGPGDRHVLPRLIERIEAGRMKLIGDGRKLLNNTSVHNFADAVALALQQPEAEGETFNIRDRRLVTRQEFVTTIADYLGAAPPGRVPEWLARALVPLTEGFAKLRGTAEAPLLTRARIKFLARNLDFSIDKAQRLLGYEPRVDFQDGMRQALDWARSAGLITGAVPGTSRV